MDITSDNNPQTYGIKVSQLGYDVQTAADQNLLFSSSWPLIKIAFTDSVSIPAGTTKTIPHNLGYPPLFFSQCLDVTLTNTSIQTTVDSNNLYITSGASGSTTVRYYICRNPLNINYQAIDNVSVQTADTVTYDPNFGIKITKPNKDMSSTDLRDYTVHSGTRSIMVEAIVYGSITGGSQLPGGSINTIFYKSPLPYSALFLGYWSPDNITWYFLSGFSQTGPKTTRGAPTDTSYKELIWIVPGSSITYPTQYGSLYVFKDPFLTNPPTQVTYNG